MKKKLYNTDKAGKLLFMHFATKSFESLKMHCFTSENYKLAILTILVISVLNIK